MIIALLTMLGLLIFWGNLSRENPLLTEPNESEIETATGMTWSEALDKGTLWGEEGAEAEIVDEEKEILENLVSEENTTWKKQINKISDPKVRFPIRARSYR